jgi:phosphoribosylanthranilate isomerase
MVNIKICGITNPDDAHLAAGLGVDALGFIFAPSPRRITPEAARAIIETLPPMVQTVGVFVNETEKTIREIVEYCGLSLIQLHGGESPEFCQKFRTRVVKAFRVKDEESLESIRSYQGQVRAILLDTYQKGLAGGTGKTFPWELAKKAKEIGLPVILSGGLTPGNVEEAIRIVRPYAVDVNSGIEERPGKKSSVLMRQLMQTVFRTENLGSGRSAQLPDGSLSYRSAKPTVLPSY